MKTERFTNDFRIVIDDFCIIISIKSQILQIQNKTHNYECFFFIIEDLYISNFSIKKKWIKIRIKPNDSLVILKILHNFYRNEFIN